MLSFFTNKCCLYPNCAIHSSNIRVSVVPHFQTPKKALDYSAALCTPLSTQRFSCLINCFYFCRQLKLTSSTQLSVCILQHEEDLRYVVEKITESSSSLHPCNATTFNFFLQSNFSLQHQNIVE